jgi:hypothetical protein
MSTKVIKNDLLKAKKKNSFCTINVQKISLNSNFKNLKLSNKNNIPRELIHRTINTTIINSNKNKNKLIIPNLVNTINLEKRRKKNIQLRNFPTLKLKNFSSSFINSNYFDINNNNYFVNLYNTSNPKIVKKENIPKKIVTKENKNLVNKIKYFKLKNLKKNINLHIKAKSFERKKYSLNDIKINEADKKMKNYRNKLLLEFMKHFQRFILLNKKRYFSFLIEQIKSIKRKEFSYKFIYKKKIQQISRNNNKDKFYTYNNISSKQILKSQNSLNKKMNLDLIKRKIIVNKIINNQSEEVIKDEIRNVFITPNNINKTFFKKNNINHSFKQGKENKNFFKLNSKPIKKANVTEIEVNFKRNIKDISPKKNKINLRFNEIKYKYNKKKSISSNNQNYLTKSFAKKKIYK